MIVIKDRDSWVVVVPVIVRTQRCLRVVSLDVYLELTPVWVFKVLG